MVKKKIKIMKLYFLFCFDKDKYYFVPTKKDKQMQQNKNCMIQKTVLHSQGSLLLHSSLVDDEYYNMQHNKTA